jgi:hypothetical protein
MPRRSKGKVEIKIRLYPGRDDELIEWLAQFDDQPYAVKTQAVKEALCRGIGTGHGLSGAEGPLQATDAAPALHRSAELTASLEEIRQVVEAAAASALGRFACTLQGEGQVLGAAATTPGEEDDEVEDLLDAFQNELVPG